MNALNLNKRTLDDIRFHNTVLNVHSKIENLNQFMNHYKDLFNDTSCNLNRQLKGGLGLFRPNANDASNIGGKCYQLNFDQHTKERCFHKNNNALVRDFRNSANKVKWIPGVLIDREGSRI
jgi:hypothetical protein